MLPNDMNIESEVPASKTSAPELEIKSPSSELAKKLDDLKKRTIGIINQTVSETEVLLGVTIDTQKVKEISQEEALTQATKISDPDNKQKEDLSQVSYVVQRMKLAVGEINEQREPLAKRLNDLNDELTLYGYKEEQHNPANQKGLIKKAVGSVKQHSYQKRQIEIKREGQEVADQINELNGKHREYETSYKNVRKYQRGLVGNQVGIKAQEIKKQYSDFYEDITTNTDIVHELRQAFVDQRIVPELQKLVREGRTSQEDADILLEELENIPVPDISDPYGRTPETPDSVEEILNKSGLYYVRQYVEMIVRGADKQMIENLVSDMAYADLRDLEDRVQKIGGIDDSYDWKYHVESNLNYVRKNAQVRFSRSDFEDESKLKDLGELSPDNNWQSMYVFDATKATPSVIEIFGERINEVDQEIYETALHKSLVDTQGGYIDNLAHYPTPDAIRNFVIIAAADSEQYRTNHANNSLTMLAERSDWPDLIDQAIEKYPGLKSSKEFLLNWKYTEYSNRPGVQEAFRDFAVSLFSDDNASSRLRELALQSLPNSSLLEILNSKGSISQEDFILLNQSGQFLEDITERIWNARRDDVLDNKYPYINDYHYKDGLRSILFGLINDSTNESYAKNISRLVELSSKMLDIQEDLDTMSYLSSGSVVEAVITSNVDMELIFKFPLLAPNIASNGRDFSDIFQKADILLRTEEDIRFLNSLAGFSENIGNTLLTFYCDALVDGAISYEDRYKFVNLEFLNSLAAISAKHKVDKDVIPSPTLPGGAPLPILPEEDFEQELGEWIIGRYMSDLVQGKITIDNKDQIYDIAFLTKLSQLPGVDHRYLVDYYLNSLEAGTILYENRDTFLEIWLVFSETFTSFSPKRNEAYMNALQSPFGKALKDLIPDNTERNKLIFDYACFSERFESVKMGLLINAIRKGYSKNEINKLSQYLRWLPETSIDLNDSMDNLQKKYGDAQGKLRGRFGGMFSTTNAAFLNKDNVNNLTSRLNGVCEWFGLKSRQIIIDGVTLSLPEEFIRDFNTRRREDSTTQFLPELGVFVINKISQASTAYTLEDLTYSQIGETEDRTGRRRGQYSAETLLVEMENNVEASLTTWSNAITYQKETPEKLLFIIANERTGPADLAAEYLPDDFASRFNISKWVNYDNFYSWVQQNNQTISDLYDRFRLGEDVSQALPQELFEWLGADKNKIIPLYRLKIPSSLNAASIEPDGIDIILDVLKLTSIMGGKTLFMDESTRSAPRSIECLYNVLQRRQSDLGGVNIKLFGKINNTRGQNGTYLQEVSPSTAVMNIAMIDPWHSQTKPVNDDSVGFVPEVTGKGIVEVVKPSYTSVSPYGVGTIQDFWKQMMANEVSFRYEGFSESGGTLKRREEFRMQPTVEEEILTQQELKDLAFKQEYKALVVDLDGTLGSKGEYSSRALEKIKDLTANGVDVVVGTARSIVDHPEYSGSVKSLIEQFGNLTEEQMKHIHLATENGTAITTLADLNSPHLNLSLPIGVSNLVNNILSVNPNIKTYSEQGTVVLRDFDQDRKIDILNQIREDIEKSGLPLKVVSDSRRSIQIRHAGASKRNILDWLESKGIGVNEIAKIGDSADGNDRPMFWGIGSFNVGSDRDGTVWTIHMEDSGGGIIETEEILDKLKFVNRI